MSGSDLKRKVESPRQHRKYKVTYIESSARGSRKERSQKQQRSHSRERRDRVAPEERQMVQNGRKSRVRKNRPTLSVDVSSSSRGDKDTYKLDTPQTAASTPPGTAPTPRGIRGKKDLRSPSAKRTPKAEAGAVPDFITQTDRFGNATTPRSADAVKAARKQHPTGPKPHLHVTPEGRLEEDADETDYEVDPCETLLDSIRLMCCCLLPDDECAKPQEDSGKQVPDSTDTAPIEEVESQIKLLPKHHPDDFGKKCLVLDLDETLVHSSFRAVAGADFVIPVQIEDVVHFVYVAKRPGVDEFLIEMAKHYEVVVYTASLNKYADPLLDLLDPNRVIRSRLFRESCVYYEGNYVKDLSLLDRDLSQAIIVDNSPASYIFHPENAIDCSSFIDDPADRELDQIAAFLKGIRNVKDVRGIAPRWREWPDLGDLEMLPEERQDSQ